MPVYDGINGVVRKRKEWPVGINGVVRQQKEHWAGINGVKRQIFSTGTPVGNLAVGGVVQLNENGVAQDYLCVHQGLPSSLYDSSCDGTWLLRKSIVRLTRWTSHDNNALATSLVQAILDNFVNLYDDKLQSVIKQVKIPYCVGNGSAKINSGANGLLCKCFLLSGYELGYTTSYSRALPIDGEKLSYFLSGDGSDAKQKRVAVFNSLETAWWTRSPNKLSTSHVWYINISGSGINTYGRYDEHGLRPCIILPQDFVF